MAQATPSRCISPRRRCARRAGDLRRAAGGELDPSRARRRLARRAQPRLSVNRRADDQRHERGAADADRRADRRTTWARAAAPTCASAGARRRCRASPRRRRASPRATGGTRSTQLGITRQHRPGDDGRHVVVGRPHRERQRRVRRDRRARALQAGPHQRRPAFFQHAHSVGDASPARGFNLYGLSLNYADPAAAFPRVSGSAQLRTGDGAGVSLTLGALGAISPDISLFALVNDARAAGSNQSDERVGLAWRPSRSDNGVTLLQYERQDGTSTLNNTQSGVLSLEQVLRVRDRTTLVGRYAYKLNGDSTYAAQQLARGAARRPDDRLAARRRRRSAPRRHPRDRRRARDRVRRREPACAWATRRDWASATTSARRPIRRLRRRRRAAAST